MRYNLYKMFIEFLTPIFPIDDVKGDVKKPELITYQNYIEDVIFSVIADSPQYIKSKDNVDAKITVITRKENLLVCIHTLTDYILDVLKNGLEEYIPIVSIQELNIPNEWIRGNVKDIEIRQINDLDEYKIDFYRQYFNDFGGKLIKEFTTSNGYKFVYKFKDNRYATNIGFAFSGRYVLSENKACIHNYARKTNYYMNGNEVEYANKIHKIFCAYIDVADSKITE